MKKKLLALLLIAVMTVTALAGCGGDKASSSDKAFATPLTSGQSVTGTDYTIMMPDGWDSISTANLGGVAVDIAYGKLVPDGTFNSNITIMLDDANIQVTPDQYLEEMKKQLGSLNYSLVEDGSANINGQHATYLIYTAEYSGLTMQGLQVYVKSDKHLFIITYTDLASVYPTNVETIKSAIASLSF